MNLKKSDMRGAREKDRGLWGRILERHANPGQHFPPETGPYAVKWNDPAIKTFNVNIGNDRDFVDASNHTRLECYGDNAKRR